MIEREHTLSLFLLKIGISHLALSVSVCANIHCACAVRSLRFSNEFNVLNYFIKYCRYF